MSEQLEQFRMLIGGKAADASSGRTFESENPYTGQPWAVIPDAGPADVDAAVQAARGALEGEWGQLTGFDRSRLIRLLGDLVSVNAERLARLEVQDSGKLYREMIGQLNGLAGWYHYYAGLADKLEGRQIPTPNPDYLVYTRREPVGVVAAITPWNSPLLLMTWKVAPALAAGCTVVIKPSEHAAASTLGFAELITEAGFPPGVVNVVTGRSREVGAALAGHPGVDKVAFTGSTATGRAVAHAAAENLNPVTLELGGKSPQIVFPDADLAAAANGIVAGVFAATGQTCMAGSRLIVHADVHDELIRLVAERASRIKLGDPNDPATEMGPVANAPQYQKVLGYLRTAVDEGAQVAYGGAADDSLGGLLRQAHGAHRGRAHVHRRAGGDLRPRAVGLRLHRRGRGGQAGQRHAVRPGRLGMDRGRAPRAPGRGPDQGRHGLDQRLPGGRAERPVRWLQGVRAGPGERRRRGQRLHREQERLGRAQRRHPRSVQARLT